MKNRLGKSRGSVTLIEVAVVMSLVGIFLLLGFRMFSAGINQALQKDRCVLDQENYIDGAGEDCVIEAP